MRNNGTFKTSEQEKGTEQQQKRDVLGVGVTLVKNKGLDSLTSGSLISCLHNSGEHRAWS